MGVLYLLTGIFIGCSVSMKLWGMFVLSCVLLICDFWVEWGFNSMKNSGEENPENKDEME